MTAEHYDEKKLWDIRHQQIAYWVHNHTVTKGCYRTWLRRNPPPDTATPRVAPGGKSEWKTLSAKGGVRSGEVRSAEKRGMLKLVAELWPMLGKHQSAAGLRAGLSERGVDRSESACRNYLHELGLLRKKRK